MPAFPEREGLPSPAGQRYSALRMKTPATVRSLRKTVGLRLCRVPFLLLFLGSLVGRGQSSAGDHPVWGPAMEAVRAQVQTELRTGQITGVAIAWVDGQDLIWNEGFGWADPRRRRAVDTNTVFRAGSISKLFNAVAVMQQVEQGTLDLDAPVTRYLPNFQITNPHPGGEPVTLRQLLCHRSGMIRESPVGNYFDPAEPGVEATARSLSGCPLILPPNTRTKYSNSGVTVSGWAVEAVTSIPYAKYQNDSILQPLGMTQSSFLAETRVRRHLARGQLPVAQAEGGFRVIDAPQFELGILPGGNLYTTSGDLARFVQCLFRQGQLTGGALVQPDTLKEMWTVQLTQATNGFGLGFSIGHHRGLRTIGHMGAVYGFTSSLLAIPEHELGVVVLANDDIAIGAVRRLTSLSIQRLLETKIGLQPEPTPPEMTEGPIDLTPFAGEYESESYWARIEPGDGKLSVIVSRQPMTFLPIDPNAESPKFEAHGRLTPGSPVVFRRAADAPTSITGFSWQNQIFHRVPEDRIQSIPPAWQAYLGFYGPDFIPLIISVRNGNLYAMIENEYDNRLTPLTDTVFKLPPGMYVDEHLVFHPDRRGRVNLVSLASIPLRRFRP